MAIQATTIILITQMFAFRFFLLQFVLFRLSLRIFPELKSFLLAHTELGFLVIVWNGYFCCVITEMFLIRDKLMFVSFFLVIESLSVFSFMF